jgi:hypothetical protein
MRHRTTPSSPTTSDRGSQERPARVAALAGRLFDDLGRDVAARVFDEIRERLRQCFIDERVATLVCSAARGADLLAIDVAAALGIRRRIVLPSPVETFRRTSVATDGTSPDWDRIYDSAVEDAREREDLVILASERGTYREATERVLADARALAGAERPLAIVVWDGKARSESDATQEFKDLAAGDFDISEILVGSDSMA